MSSYFLFLTFFKYLFKVSTSFEVFNLTKIVISSNNIVNKTRKSKKKKTKKMVEGINVYYVENLVNF